LLPGFSVIAAALAPVIVLTVLRCLKKSYRMKKALSPGKREIVFRS
jgi:hypothetical protein